MQSGEGKVQGTYRENSPGLVENRKKFPCCQDVVYRIGLTLWNLNTFYCVCCTMFSATANIYDNKLNNCFLKTLISQTLVGWYRK